LDRTAAKAGFGPCPLSALCRKAWFGAAPTEPRPFRSLEADFALVRQMQILDYNKLIDGYLAKGP
jgi:hypothetical protein